MKYRWTKGQMRTLKYLEDEYMYVITQEKHGSRIFLVDSEDALVETMFTLLMDWNDSEWVSQLDWYFTGTYEEFFFKEMGFNTEWYKEHLRSLKSPNHHMQKLIDSAESVEKRYNEHREGIEDATLIEDILTNGLEDREWKLYNLLDGLTYNDRKMFDLCRFN